MADRWNRVNLSHLRPEPFFVDGAARGFHHVEQIGEQQGYFVSAALPGALPALLLRRRLALRLAELAPDRGVAQGLPEGMNLALVGVSTGDGFPDVLFGRPELTALLSRHSDLVEVVELTPRSGVTHLTVRTWGDPRFGVDLAELVCRSALDLIERKASFSDAQLARIGVRTDEGASPEVIERLVEHLTEATSWLAGHAARVGDAVEAHLTLDEGGAEIEGILRIAWRDPGARVVDMSLKAALPEGLPATLVLTPQKGAWARLRGIGDTRVGDEELDRRYLIEGDVRHGAAVRAAREPLLALYDEDARVELDGVTLTILVPPRDRAPVAMHDVAQHLLGVWRHVAVVRGGVVTEGTPDPE